jgi:hypothetical protein
VDYFQSVMEMEAELSRYNYVVMVISIA